MKRDIYKRPAVRSTGHIETLEDRKMFSGTPLIDQTNLVTDGAIAATHTDANLKNPWGIANLPGAELWVSDNNSGFSTLYNADGSKVSLNVVIPPATGNTGAATPTGIVVNKVPSFNITSGSNTGSAEFIFDSEDGTISAWSSSVNISSAIKEVDNSASGAVYKGLAVAGHGDLRRLYAANFNSGNIDVFDSNFQPTTTPGGFVDPNLPAGYAPFNITKIEEKLYVTYALQDGAKHDPVHQAGAGIVDVFGRGGRLQKRLATGGTLNAPWAVTVSPSTFGDVANKILIGNFGDGKISAFGRAGRFLGQLNGLNGQPLVIDGLWALVPNTTGAGDPNALFFDAGPNGEANGLLGTLTAAS